MLNLNTNINPIPDFLRKCINQGWGFAVPDSPEKGEGKGSYVRKMSGSGWILRRFAFDQINILPNMRNFLIIGSFCCIAVECEVINTVMLAELEQVCICLGKGVFVWSKRKLLCEFLFEAMFTIGVAH